MPWWASLYFTVLSLVFLIGTVDDWRDNRPWGLVAADLIGEMAVLVVGLAYWIDPLAKSLVGPFVPLYFFAVISQIVSGYLDLRRLLPAPDLSREANLWIGIVGTAVGVALTLPALYWGALVLSTHGIIS